jgi:O-antigen ligase
VVGREETETWQLSYPSGKIPMLYLVYGYLALLIIRPFENWNLLGAIHLERIYGILMLICWLMWRHKGRICSLQTTAVFAFLGAIGMSALFAYQGDVAWIGFHQYLTVVVLYLMLRSTIKNESKLRQVVMVYISIMAAYQLLSLREFLFFGRGIWSGGIWRLCGLDRTYGHPNSLAASIAYSVPFALGILNMKARFRLRLAAAAYTALSLACIVLTGSRSGLLTFVLVCLLYMLSLRGKRKIYALVVFCIFFWSAWQLTPPDKLARVETLGGKHMNLGEQKSAEDRMQGKGFWRGLRVFRDRPLLGVGFWNFSIYSRDQLGDSGVDTHNLYGELLSQLGIVGTLAFAWMVGIIARNSLLVRKGVRSGIVPRGSLSACVAWATLAMLCALLFDGWASHNVLRYNWLFGAAIGLLARDFALRKKEQEADDRHQDRTGAGEERFSTAEGIAMHVRGRPRGDDIGQGA